MKFNSLIVFAILMFHLSAFAQDWPEYMNDNQRSGVTTVNLKSPLHLKWKYQATVAPRPAWPAPAKTDFWHREANLKPRVIYDRAYHVISVGDKVYFGSSANDKIYCIDANTGEELWSYFTGGPVRLAPTVVDGLLYAGSDDGVAYCLNADSGELEWKINTAEGKPFFPGNGRMIPAASI